jgi:hypothetical protein
MSIFIYLSLIGQPSNQGVCERQKYLCELSFRLFVIRKKKERDQVHIYLFDTNCLFGLMTSIGIERER